MLVNSSRMMTVCPRRYIVLHTVLTMLSCLNLERRNNHVRISLSQTFLSLLFDKGCLSLSKHRPLRSSRGGAGRRREKNFRKKKQGSKEEKKTLGKKK